MGTRWEIMRRSAYKKQARRWSGLIVALDVGIHVAPWAGLLLALGALVWAVAWAWHHIPAGSLALLAFSGAVLVAVSWIGYEVATASAVRKGVTVPRLAMSGASVALALAAVFAVMYR
jgi:hypothetical protein